MQMAPLVLRGKVLGSRGVVAMARRSGARNAQLIGQIARLKAYAISIPASRKHVVYALELFGKQNAGSSAANAAESAVSEIVALSLLEALSDEI